MNERIILDLWEGSVHIYEHLLHTRHFYLGYLFLIFWFLQWCQEIVFGTPVLEIRKLMTRRAPWLAQGHTLAALVLITAKSTIEHAAAQVSEPESHLLHLLTLPHPTTHIHTIIKSCQLHHWTISWLHLILSPLLFAQTNPPSFLGAALPWPFKVSVFFSVKWG